jgi:hypothetical protein
MLSPRVILRWLHTQRCDSLELAALLATWIVLTCPHASTANVLAQLQALLCEVRGILCRCGHSRARHCASGVVKVAGACQDCGAERCGGYRPPDPNPS